LLMLAATIPFLPFDKLGMTNTMDAKTVAMMLLGTLPFAFLSAALLSLVASFTKSYKEAQTWLSAIMVIPIIPGFINMLYPMEPSITTMLAPIVSQTVLLTEFIKGKAVPINYIALSAATTLILTVILGWITVKLYEREIVTG
ncbi:MAG TPA: hypothetical protein VFP95_02250, partial [Gammaproteobacteria bacterium]|nr:hypothetical protein [Gammaproteobacteria bacterium]